MTLRDTAAYSNHTWLLNEAKEIVNEEIKSLYNQGKLSSPYDNGSWLDLIQVFDYTLDFWNGNTINQELFDLIIKIKIYNIRPEVAKEALQYIAHYIINTQTAHWWNRPIYRGNLLYVLGRYYGLNKPLNYDYLRYVINHIRNENETVVITS